MTLPLHEAVENMDAEAVRALIAAGADIDAPCPDLVGARPLHIAVDIECEAACRREELGDANARPQATITRVLIEAGANPDLPDASGASARAWAAERDHQEALACFGARPPARIKVS